MEWSHYLIAASLLGGLGFVTSLASTFVLRFSLENTFIAFVVGVVYCGLALICLIVALALRTDYRVRFLVALTGLVSAAGGVALSLLPDHYHLTASYLNRFAAYVPIVAGVSFLITILWPSITRGLIKTIIAASHIDLYDEFAMYLGVSFVGSVVLAGVFPFPKGVALRELLDTGMSLGICVWFVQGILAAVIGIAIGHKSDPGMTAAYEAARLTSKPTSASGGTLPFPDSYTKVS
jgi:uncharacterized membrane protein